MSAVTLATNEAPKRPVKLQRVPVGHWTEDDVVPACMVKDVGLDLEKISSIYRMAYETSKKHESGQDFFFDVDSILREKGSFNDDVNKKGNV